MTPVVIPPRALEQNRIPLRRSAPSSTIMTASDTLLYHAARLLNSDLRLRRRTGAWAGLLRSFRIKRLDEIQDAIRDATPGFVFIVGDSHAQMLGTPSIGRPVVNGGVGSTLAIETAELLEELQFAEPAGAAVVIVGQNDVNLDIHPRSGRRTLQFRSALRRIASILRKSSERIIFVAIPPLGPNAITRYDRAAIVRYSGYIDEFCRRNGYLYVDLFAELRSSYGDTALVAVEMDEEGTHLIDYGRIGISLRSVIRSALDGASPADVIAAR